MFSIDKCNKQRTLLCAAAGAWLRRSAVMGLQRDSQTHKMEISAGQQLAVVTSRSEKKTKADG